MSLPHILLLVCAAAFVLWIAPSLLSMLLVFFRRFRPGVAMSKPYFAPCRDEMDRCIAFLEQLEQSRVRVTAADGVPLSAAWFDRHSDRTVLMAHGYKASAMSNFCVSGKAFWDAGYNLLLIDQRSSGQSGGHATTFGLTEQYDLLRWIEWIEANTATADLVVYGVSMGCAAIAYASDKLTPDRVRAMVLDCGFLSPRAQLTYVAVERHVPWQIMMPIIRAGVRLSLGADINTTTLSSLRATEIPAVFLHGEKDRTVPLEDGRLSYEACASEKEFIAVPEAEHTMAFLVGGDEVRARLFAFLTHAIEAYHKQGKEGLQ